MLKKIVLLLSATLYSGSALAVCAPQEFIKPDTEFSTSATALKWSQLNSISRERFEEMKRNGHLWLSLPKVPLISKIDYDDFKRIVQAESANQSQDLSLVQTQTIYRSNLSSEATKNYIACLQNENGYLDISVPPAASNIPDFFVTLTFMGPRGSATGKFDAIGGHNFQIIGGKVEDEASYDKIESLKNGQSLRVKVHRDLDKPFAFSASVDGFSNEVGLPPKEDPTVVKFEVVRSEEQPAYADGAGNQHNKFCLPAKDGQILLPSTLQLVDRQFPGNGKVWTDKAGAPDEKLICATANAEMYGGTHVIGNARIFSRIEVLSIIDSK